MPIDTILLLRIPKRIRGDDSPTQFPRTPEDNPSHTQLTTETKPLTRFPKYWKRTSSWGLQRNSGHPTSFKQCPGITLRAKMHSCPTN